MCWKEVEAQMRTITGQIEELTHQLQVLQDQLNRMQSDNEYRFGQLEGGSAAAPAGQAAAGTTTIAKTPAGGAQPNAVAQAQPQPLPAPGTKTPAQQVIATANAPRDVTGLGAPPQPLGTLPADADQIDAPPSQAQPLDLSTLAGGNDDTQPGMTIDQGTPAGQAGQAAAPAQVASIAPTGDPRADYDQAYRLVTAGRYDIAETAFRQFLTAYPGDGLAPDAQYWLGESLYAHGDYAGAAQEFKAGYQKYPKSRRAPDSLLKLGLSMAGLDYRDEACKMYALALKQYPQMSNGLRSRVKAEQASAGC